MTTHVPAMESLSKYTLNLWSVPEFKQYAGHFHLDDKLVAKIDRLLAKAIEQEADAFPLAELQADLTPEQAEQLNQFLAQHSREYGELFHELKDLHSDQLFDMLSPKEKLMESESESEDPTYSPEKHGKDIPVSPGPTYPPELAESEDSGSEDSESDESIGEDELPQLEDQAKMSSEDVARSVVEKIKETIHEAAEDGPASLEEQLEKLNLNGPSDFKATLETIDSFDQSKYEEEADEDFMVKTEDEGEADDEEEGSSSEEEEGEDSQEEEAEE